MNALQVDPKTGFLDADNINSFGAQRKERFLAICHEFREKTKKWPDFGIVARELGINLITLERHLRIDEKFREAFRELTLGGKFQLESQMYELSVKNPMYAFGWLRKFFPEEYNPEHRMTVTHEHNVLSRLADEAKQAIDADIVEGQPKLSA